jgi:hypothetical protein
MKTENEIMMKKEIREEFFGLENKDEFRKEKNLESETSRNHRSLTMKEITELFQRNLDLKQEAMKFRKKSETKEKVSKMFNEDKKKKDCKI